MAVGADLAYPAVPGRRTAQIKIVNSYLPRLHAAATHDAALGGAFMPGVSRSRSAEGALAVPRLRRARPSHDPVRVRCGATRSLQDLRFATGLKNVWTTLDEPYRQRS